MSHGERGIGKLFLISAIAGLVVVGGGGATAFILMRSPAEPPAQGEDGGEENRDAEVEKVVLTLDSFIVNLAAPDSARYLKVTLRVLLDSSLIREEIRRDDVVEVEIRDRVLTLLASKTLADVGNPKGKEVLRKELQAAIAEVFGEGVLDVLFGEFVIQ